MEQQYTPRHHTLHLADMQSRPRYLQSWERMRHRGAHWFVECFAEALGVFLYCYAGIGATAAWVLGGYIKQELGSLFTVGIAYAMGIVLALVICSATSGGIIHPGLTITMVVFKGLPPAKALRYIIAQVLGGYIACLVIYLQWKHVIVAVEETLVASGTWDAVAFQPTGPAGIFALYATDGASLGLIFFNEFVCDLIIGLTIFAVLDPTSFLVTPWIAPWVVGGVYAMAIWGFSPVGLAANSARDVGGRLMAITIWGTKASGGSYAAIAALTNIPATMLAYIIYEFMFVDSSRMVPGVHREYHEGHKAHMEHRENSLRYGLGPERNDLQASPSDLDAKDHVVHRELAA